MVLLTGLVASLVTQIIKKFSDKYGKQMTELAIYGSMFILSVVYASLVHLDIISMDFVQTVATVLTSGIGTYELLLKRLGALTKGLK